MSKRLMIIIYVVAVLIFSGFAANSASLPINITTQSSVPVDGIKVDQAKGLLFVAGHLQTACQTKPLINIVSVDHKTRTVEFDVLAQQSTQVCIDLAGPNYDIVFNLKELNLKAGENYSILFKSYTNSRTRYTYLASEKVNRIELNGYQPNTVNGTLQKDKENYELIKGSGKIRIESAAAMNISGFENSKVWINGYLGQTSENENQELLAILPISISAIH